MDNKNEKKKTGKIKSPENMDEYIRVVNPSIWLILIAVIVLLIGAFIWAIFGSVEGVSDGGIVERIRPISFLLN